MSRFSICPVCNCSVASCLLNDHLDGCLQKSRPAKKQKCSFFDKLPRSPCASKAAFQNWSSGNGKVLQDLLHRPTQSLASVRRFSFSRKDRKESVTDLELRQAVPFEIVRDILPGPLADQVLQQLLSDAQDWVQGKWWIAGKEYTAPRSSCFYTIANTQAFEEHAAQGHALDVSKEVSGAAAPACLIEAAAQVNSTVSCLKGRVRACLAPDDKDQDWQGSYALANLYKDGLQCVGPHADKLTQLGPRPVIASLSLGATRTFRIHRAGNCTLEGAAVQAADILLPHNTLVIMWPPAQEEWRHEVPKCKTCKPHPLSGVARLNLTFRRLKPDWAARAPRCRCNRQAVMRSRTGQNGTKYHYKCDNSQGPECGFWQTVSVT